jgi:DNA-binding SARP family transcriptional activator
LRNAERFSEKTLLIAVLSELQIINGSPFHAPFLVDAVLHEIHYLGEPLPEGTMADRPLLRCLGHPALFAPTGEPVRFRTKKHLALLVYLSVEPPKAHRRDRLGEVFWPNVATTEARHSLATALSTLRPRLGPGALEATREHVLLSKGAVQLDIDRLESGDILGTETREPLLVAAFLEGFDISDSPEFALWKDRKRASLLPAIKSALVKLIDECRRTADVRQIEHFADLMLAIDELSEEAVRAKMEARAFAGDRLTALRVFEDWKVRLEEAVGAQPSALVEGMAVRLRRRGWERTGPSDIPTVPTDQWRGRLFVGRFDEYRLLYDAWEHSRRGRARHALVVGDSGVGKTTLVNRLVTAAGLEGAVVSRTQCYDLEGEIPYATLGNLTLGLLDLPGVSATPPEALAELAKYFTGVKRRFPATPVVEDSQGETARLRLTEAFSQALEVIADEHPVILVIDDLHLCDEASLSVLHLLMHRVALQPIMFVLVARAGELPRSPIARRLRTGAHVLGVQEIETAPLSETESNEVLLGLLGPSRAGVDSALRRAMVRVAGGYPMVLELLVQDWEVNGSHSLALALDSMTADFGSASEAPELYGKVLDRLVFALDHGTKHVLNVAAVLGHRLNDLALYAIADLGPGQVMAAMADLVRHRVLRDSGRGLEFVNEFVRTAAYLEVPSPVRRALHAGISSRLMNEKSRGVQFLGLEIAWHAIRAGQASDVAEHLLTGAQEAIAQGALDTAAKALSTALPQLAAVEREAAALLLAEALQEQGRWVESASIIDTECSQESTGLGKVFSIIAAHRTAAPTAEQLHRDVKHLLEIISSDREVHIRLQAVNAAAQLMGDVLDRSIASGLYSAAFALHGDALAEDERTQLDLCLSQLLYYSGQQAAASEALARLVEHFQTRGIANSRLVRVYGGIGAVRCFEGKYEEARIAYQTGYSVAVRIGNEQQQSLLAAQHSLCLLRLGEYKELLEWTSHAAPDGVASRYQLIQVSYYSAFALAMLGESRTAIQEFESLGARIPPGGPAWLIQTRQLLGADILCLSGERAVAAAQAREALGVPPILHAPSFAGPFARWLALCSDGKDRPEHLQVLNELSSRMDELDLLDRAEVLCARRILGEGRAVETEDLLRSTLASLPPAVAGQLRRLGVL